MSRIVTGSTCWRSPSAGERWLRKLAVTLTAACAALAWAVLASVGELSAAPPAESSPPAAGLPAAGPPEAPPPMTADRMAKLLRQLGDDHWTVREAATEELRGMPLTLLPMMLREFRTSRDAEVRARIPEIARECFWRRHAGFLGIAMELGIESVNAGVLVKDVLDGTAAAKAGIQPGDLIVEFHGQRIGRISDMRKEFSKYVLARGQALPTKVKVVRNDREIELAIALGPLPAQQLKLKLESVEAEDLEQFQDWWQDQLRALGPNLKPTVSPAVRQPN